MLHVCSSESVGGVTNRWACGLQNRQTPVKGNVYVIFVILGIFIYQIKQGLHMDSEGMTGYS